MRHALHAVVGRHDDHRVLLVDVGDGAGGSGVGLAPAFDVVAELRQRRETLVAEEFAQLAQRPFGECPRPQHGAIDDRDVMSLSPGAKRRMAAVFEVVVDPDLFRKSRPKDSPVQRRGDINGGRERYGRAQGTTRVDVDHRRHERPEVQVEHRGIDDLCLISERDRVGGHVRHELRSSELHLDFLSARRFRLIHGSPAAERDVEPPRRSAPYIVDTTLLR